MGTSKYPNENDYSNVNHKIFSLLLKISDNQMLTPLKIKPIITLKSQVMPLFKHWIDLLNFLSVL